MATSIIFDGRTTAIPGAYTKIDASGLDAVGIGATGIVALIGTAVGGRPISDGMTADDLLRFSTPQAVRNTYRSGALREAGSMAFSPSSDADIPAGAQQVIWPKGKPCYAVLSRSNKCFWHSLNGDIARLRWRSLSR